MIRTNQTIIGQLNNPDEVVVTMFPVAQSRRKINPHLYRTGNESTPAQKRYNRKISDNKIINLIMNNFICSDLLITLTYGVEPSSVEEADKELVNYLNKLQKFYRRRNAEISYVAVTEKGDDGRLHHHIVMKKIKDMVYEDIIGRWSRRGIGQLGYVNIEAIHGNHTLKNTSANGLDDMYYTAKYLTKEPLSPSNKRYKHSDSLMEPITVSSDDLFSYDEFGTICDNPDSNDTASVLIKKLCPDDNYVLVNRQANVSFLEQTGHYHISARLRKQLNKDAFGPFGIDWSNIMNYDETDTVTISEEELYKRTYNVRSAIFKTPGIDDIYREFDLKANPKSLRGFIAQQERG